MSKDFEQQLTSVLNDAAKKLNLNKYTLNLNLDAIKGDGFLGEFYKVSIVDEETNTTHHLAVKRAPIEQFRREENSIEFVYKNEICFYSKIHPAFKEFEKEHQVSGYFDLVPGYITSVGDIGKEMIVFKDITKEGFVLREKDLLLDDDHAKLIFRTYGHYHAVGFCLKEKKPEEFAKLTKPLTHIWRNYGEKGAMLKVVRKCLEKTFEALDPVRDAAVIEKSKKYVEKTEEMYFESIDYKGRHFGIVHGDCWSNNMMFKYKDSKSFSQLQSMNLLDFQLVNVGTPVFDLSYFFYTGGSKELFDKLEDYLDVYYESFSTASRNLDCDPENLLPRQILSEDWKRYAKFGMLLSVVLGKIKLTSKEDSIEMIEKIEKQTERDESGDDDFMKIKYDEKLYLKRTRDILVHMHEIDAL